MIIYYSMIAWIVLLGFLRSIYMNGKNKEKVSLLLALITFGYIIFWVGMRSGVADTATYISGFNSTSTSLNSIDAIWSFRSKAPGFETFNILFKYFVSTDYHIWLMTLAIIMGVSIALVLRKKSPNFFYSMFLFIVTLNYTWMLNGMRQFLVVSILFLCSKWIEEGKSIRFIGMILLLSTIHYTALIMIPMYWVAREKPWKTKVLIFMGVIILCSIFVEPFVKTLESVLEGSAYQGSTAQFAMDDGVNPVRVLVMCVPVGLSFIYRKQIERENNIFINICVNMSVITAGLYFIGMFTSGILVGRLPIYFEVYNLILIPFVLKKCFRKNEKIIMYLLCTIGYFLFFYMQSGNLYYISELTGVLN